eukprot:318513-Prymnesium_polylepis.1
MSWHASCSVYSFRAIRSATRHPERFAPSGALRASGGKPDGRAHTLSLLTTSESAGFRLRSLEGFEQNSPL